MRRGSSCALGRLESDLGKAWEPGQPASCAEAELAQISKKNGEINLQRSEARQATLKRYREEHEAAAVKEPCLCTKAGAAALLRESLQLTREALAVVENRRLATAQPATASPASTPPVTAPPTANEPPAA